MWFEEVMGWILVPLIVLACYWLVETVLNGLGTSISAVFSGIRELASAF
jgi:hypothetical protein